MAKYNLQLASADDITVRTYYKNPNAIMGFHGMCNVIVTSIANIAGGAGTVEFKSCAGGEAASAPKEAVKALINLGFYSATE